RVAHVAEVVAVLEHLLDVRMPQRDHLLEAGFRAHLSGLVKQERADQRTDEDDRLAVVEDQTLKERRRFLLMLGHASGSPGFLLLCGQIRARRRGDAGTALPYQDQVVTTVGAHT